MPGKRSRLLPVPSDKVKAIKSLNNHYHDFQRSLAEIRDINDEIKSLLLAIREEQLSIGEGKAGLPGLPSA